MYDCSSSFLVCLESTRALGNGTREHALQTAILSSLRSIEVLSSHLPQDPVLPCLSLDFISYPSHNADMSRILHIYFHLYRKWINRLYWVLIT
ncbi:hypothetical protein AB1N83_004937 [Pleurotus pulmonarius]